MSVQVSGLPSIDQGKCQKSKTRLLVTPHNGYCSPFFKKPQQRSKGSIVKFIVKQSQCRSRMSSL